MKKVIISLIIFVLICVTCIGLSSCGDGATTDGNPDSEGLAFELNEEGGGYIVSGRGTCTDDDIVIPKSYENKPVTGIGDYAFSYYESLTSITIPDSVTTIGYFAFKGCTGLTSVTIGNGVTSIGAEAFAGCRNIQYNEYQNGKYLGNTENPYMIFVGTKTTDFSSFEIASTTKVIYYMAFNRTSLTSITIPDSVTYIGAYAFNGCIGLSSITIPDSVTSIGECAFYQCKELTSVTIPDSVTWIGNGAFYECEKLTSITIPDNVTSIGMHAFYGCTNLTVNCEAESKPTGWDENWNDSDCPVVWGYKGE